MAGLAQLTLFSLGGTIASRAQPGASAYVELSGEDLLRGVPAAGEVAAVQAHPLTQVASGELTLDDILRAAREIRRALDGGADGIIVTQGTDTMEETAFALDLLVDSPVPIVVTGAMRDSSQAGPDGPANLLAAIRVAASVAARDLGTLVVMNDEIHAARFVRKRYTSSPATFGSPLTGPVGHVVEDLVRIFLRPVGRVTIRPRKEPPPVALIHVGFDEQADAVERIETDRYGGAVVAVFGGGHVPSRLAPTLERLSSSLPVVMASRTFAGSMFSKTYGYPGSEEDLLSRGLISAGAYDAVHARVLLRLLLAAQAPRETITHVFERGMTSADRWVV